MSNSLGPFGPYPTPEELEKGRRRTAVYLATGVAAALLALVASRTVPDDMLVRVYVLAAVLNLVAGLGAAIRWSNTPAFETSD